MSTHATTPPLVTRADIEGIRRADFYAIVKKLTGGASLSPTERTKLDGYLVQFGEKDGAVKPDADSPPPDSFEVNAAGRATPRAKRVRVQWVAMRVAARISGPELLHLITRIWKVEWRMGQHYVAAAEKLIRGGQRERDVATARAIAHVTLDKAIAGAMDDRDWGAVAKLLEREAKLFGLDAPVVQQVQVTGTDDGPVAVLELPGG